MNKIMSDFGLNVFGDAVMRCKLPGDVYRSLKTTIEDGRELDITLANVVASAMKDWAVERGVTHFTHWFQPLTGITAEKHDSFISPASDCGNGSAGVITEFSGRELIRGESDASSFPSGGLRATFEARGYTAWDPTSYAFIKDGVLCIPTAFCSYGGEALDKKTPLLRSMDVLSDQAVRILRLFGDNETKRVIPTVGAEQEYFLIDRGDYLRRRDLQFTGRTLFGAKPPKGQELDDHYFGSLNTRVRDYMADLDVELWRLGVLAKTEHNEAAPSQHELAPIYTTTNIATDHNQLIMETMKRVAERHELTCLLHEKPFAGVNGSGKHVNWSISTSRGENLLEPGDTPSENARFLLFLSAMIAAVDDYQDLLRMSVATAGNDHRLGANEAPPAIVSMYLGDDLTGMLEAIEGRVDYEGAEKGDIEIGVHVLPKFPRDTTDRNRTSPFAFTGNKFEFRMPGSALSIADPNTVLNTIVADELAVFADKLEAADDFGLVLNRIVRHTIRDHKRIIWSGNSYSEDWLRESERRGLSNFRNTPDALAALTSDKSIRLFTRNRIFSEAEIRSRSEIMYENYAKVINIEGQTMAEMAFREILPAAEKYMKVLADTAASKRAVSQEISVATETRLLSRLSALTDSLYGAIMQLSDDLPHLHEKTTTVERAVFCRDEIIGDMLALRAVADEIETAVGCEYWSYPTYGDILYKV